MLVSKVRNRLSGLQEWRTELMCASLLVLVVLLRISIPVHICDDAFISLRTATQLSLGNGMVFNEGDRVYTVTTPLWVLLIAAIRLITSDGIVAVQLLGTVFEVLLVVTIALLVAHLAKSVSTGFLAGVLVITNPVLLLTSIGGMEVALSLWLVCLALWLFAKDNFKMALMVAAIAVWARVDNVVLLAVIGVGVAFHWRTWVSRGAREVVSLLAPAILVLAAYYIFGLLYFNSVIPESARFKAAATPALFSNIWWADATRIGREFLRVLDGKSAYWFQQPSWLGVFAIPTIVGLAYIVIRRDLRWSPLVGFTLLYAFAYTAPGNAAATHFPWYFVPVLPGAYAVAALGTRMLMQWVGRMPLLGTYIRPGVIVTLVAVAWPLVMAKPIRSSVKHLTVSSAGSYERERVYAAAAVWSSQNLLVDHTVAVVELGTTGYFSGLDVYVLDMDGLGRSPSDRGRYFVELVDEHKAHVVFSRAHFRRYKKEIDEHLPGAYVWHRFKSLQIGIRSDLEPELSRTLHEIDSIYAVISMTREPERSRHR